MPCKLMKLAFAATFLASECPGGCSQNSPYSTQVHSFETRAPERKGLLGSASVALNRETWDSRA